MRINFKLVVTGFLSLIIPVSAFAATAKCNHGVELVYSADQRPYPSKILFNGKIYRLGKFREYIAYSDAQGDLYQPWIESDQKDRPVTTFYSFRLNNNQVLPGNHPHLSCKTSLNN